MTIRRTPTVALWLALGALLGLAGCADATPPGPNVVLIVVDTLRQDHLGCYGAPRDTSPAIDRLAAQGVRFERAYSTAPWTMPSIASMLTGLLPASHGVQGITSRLADDALTLAEILADEGYATAGVVSHTLLSEEYNFQQGFGRYVVSVHGDPHADISTNRVTEQAQNWLTGFAAEGRPFFLMVHYFDPHYTYIRHRQRDGFAARSAGRLTGFEAVEELGADLTEEELDFLKGLYDEEIWFTDAGIGRLLATLQDTGLSDDTLVVLVGDHGEEFLEHGRLGHGKALYDESVRVPLIVRTPAGMGRSGVVSDAVSLVALTPTILDLLGIRSDERTFQASSLAPMLRSESAPGPDLAYFAVDSEVDQSYKKAFATRGMKFIRDDVTQEVGLYDLVLDPREQVNLAPERPADVRELLELLDREAEFAQGKLLGSEQLELSEEKLRVLRSLGYVAN